MSDRPTPRRFVLLDRDGTLIVKHHYLADPALVQLLPGTAAGLRQLRDLGLGLAVVTNQSAIGRGLLDESRLAAIHTRLVELLAAEQIDLDGLYYCPHLPEDGCPCRKPRPGMAELAAQELGFDLRESTVVGDGACDIELGRTIGAGTFLVRTGDGPSTAAALGPAAGEVVDDLAAVAARLRERMLSEAD